MSPRKVVAPKSAVRISPRVASRSSPARSPPKKAAPKKRGGAKSKFPEAIPNGEILTDLRKKQWQVGAPIGKGGFGAIYSASEVPAGKGKDLYAVKIEPKENGPLFVEMHFMMKVCQPDDIAAYQKLRKLSHLGIPRFIASGSHVYNERNYRFLIMDRFGKDIWSLFLENKQFPLSTVCQLGVQVLDVLEYIHSKGYVHADIKGSNLVLGLKKGAENSIYLIDFGLATKYTTKEYKPDPKTAHNGTIEYCSRDAHDGVSTRRGDLEILAYNLLHWTSSKLPWEKLVPNHKLVQESKNKHMADVPGLLKWCFGSEAVPTPLRNFFKYVSKMAYNEDPSYDECRKFLREGVKGKAGAKLEFRLVGQKSSEEAMNNHEESFENEEDFVVSPKRRSDSKDKQAIKKKMKK